MEAQFETNWTISDGSLHTSITFESSDSPLVDSQTLNPTPKRPLILKPSDSGPCEIKISFTQKHEIRQVYVRSTARVYEIYYAPTVKSSNEYLCTVRCGIASREEELPHTTDNEGTICDPLKGSDGEVPGDKFTSESNIGNNEDDWVEVKIPHASLLANGNNSYPKKTCASRRIIEDFYEATAEINDSDSCTCLTLRLLSPQNKECVRVDEVYVFADPIESADSENQEVANSAGSSFMAMLAPTLLQLSKSGVGQLQDKHTYNTLKQEDPKIEPGESDLTSILNGTLKDENPSIADRQDVKLQEMSGVRSQIPAQVSDRERSYGSVAKNDLLYTQVDRVIEQLVTRVSKIEDICLRFEENMLKPINSIEARLQWVEHQLEVLAKNSQTFGLPSYTRFSAPPFSSLESNSSSFYNDGSDIPEKNTADNKFSNSPGDASTTVISPQFLPSLVVTAPEFSCGDDEEENHNSELVNDSPLTVEPSEDSPQTLEPLKDSPQEKQKQALSIDDALAAAIAGFSSMSIAPPSKFSNRENALDKSSKYSQLPKDTAPESTSEESGNSEKAKYMCTLKVTAPEFLSEEIGDDQKVASPSFQNSMRADFCETSGKKCVHDSVSNSSNTFSVEHTGIDCPSAQAKHDLTEDGYQITEETSEGETNRMSKVGDNTSSINVEQMPKGDAFSSLPKYSYASSVDFEISILDVKFSSWGNSSANSPLEALLGDEAGIEDDEALCVLQGNGGVVIGELPNKLSSMENGEAVPVTSLTDNQLLMDLESDDVGKEGQGMNDKVTGLTQEIFASLI